MKEFLQVCTTILEAPGQDGWVKLFPLGPITAYDGRSFRVENAAAIVAASKRSHVDLVIDRDHQIEFSQKGTSIVAAGWMKNIEARADGIYALIEWTASAREQLERKEYRYISPSFYTDKSGVVQKIIGASLVNRPALELQAVASATLSETQEETMDKSLLAVAAAMGLAATVSAEAIVTAAQERFKLLEDLTLEAASVRKSLGLDEKAETKLVLETAAAKSTDEANPGKFVPMSMYKETAGALANLQHDIAKEKSEQAVSDAIKARKISPALKDWAINYASTDAEGFRAFVATAPAIVGDGGTGEGTPDTTGARGDAGDLEVCRQLGISIDEYNGKKAA